jgi:hypothetical protein
VPLDKVDTIMVYADATIDMIRSDGTIKSFKGPFYTSVDAVYKTYHEERPSLMKSLEINEILDRIDDIIVGPTKGDDIEDHYVSIMKTKGKQKERELLEDFLFNEFLPIRVVIESRSPLTFSSNFDLWWAAFRYNGEKLEEITKTIDHSLHPQERFKLEENMVKLTKADMDIRGSNKEQCVFILACADWGELEKYNKIEYAEKELLAGDIKVTTRGKVMSYGKVIVKLCF